MYARIPHIDALVPGGCRIRLSPRARNVNLSVAPGEGLTVVVPERFDLARLPDILKSKRSWIEQAVSWASGILPPEPPTPAALPVHIDLAALGEGWVLERRKTGSDGARVRECGFRRLRLCGAVHDSDASFRALRRWLARRAKASLAPLCHDLAARHDMPLRGTSVRNQRSLWASCSPSRTVNINLKLLFLPPHLSRYVLLHELCHTVELNHSRRFWRLVQSIEPAWDRHERELRSAGRLVPGWV